MYRYPSNPGPEIPDFSPIAQDAERRVREATSGLRELAALGFDPLQKDIDRIIAEAEEGIQALFGFTTTRQPVVPSIRAEAGMLATRLRGELDRAVQRVRPL